MAALRPPGLALSRSAPLRTKLPVKDDPVKCPFLSLEQVGTLMS